MARYLVFTVVGFSFVMASISGTMVSVAFPQITASFDTTIILAGWVLSITQVVSVAVMPLAGKAGDIFGRKKTYLVALGCFTIGSLCSALAPHIILLIISRAIQAIGVGSLLPLGTALIADEFPQMRQQAIGLLSSIFPIGQIIGPNIGGWLTESFGWRANFWFNVPVAVLAFAAAAYLLKPGTKKEGHIDLVGIGLFTGAIFAFITALGEIGNQSNAPAWLGPVLFAAAVVLMLAFFRREGKSRDPVIAPQLLRQRPFLAANLYNLLFGICTFSTMAFVPLYAVSIYGMSTLASGVILTPRSIGMVAASVVTSYFLPRWGYRVPMLIGTAGVAASLLLLSLEPGDIRLNGIQISSTFLLGVNMLFSGIAMGIAAPASNNACIELMPDRVATIAGVRGMFRQSGGAISIATSALILQSSGDMFRGFTILFIALTGVALLTVPLIFIMPKSP